MKPDIRDHTREGLEEKLAAAGQKKCHAALVFACLYRKGAAGFDAMEGVPAGVRSALAAAYSLSPLPASDKSVSMKDGTVKFLFRFRGGAPAESVLLRNKGRSSACLSSQSGCACGCSFCATGAMGLNRDLKPSEITAQFAACLRAAGGWLDSVVFMGMGEPFLNWENVKKAVRILSDGAGWGFPQRKMTMSTVGVAPVIDELAASDLRIKLAISVVTADPELRARLVPLEKKYPLSGVIEAARNYCRARGVPVLFEYILFPGLNDSPADAERLAALIGGMDCRLNLIRHNPARDAGGGRPADAAGFQKRMIAAGVRTYLRPDKGSDIGAACGQLAADSLRSL